MKIKYFIRWGTTLGILLILSCGPVLKKTYYLDVETVNVETDVALLVDMLGIGNRGEMRKQIFDKSARYFLTHVKQAYGDKKWQEFVKKVSVPHGTIESALMQVYDKTIYGLADQFRSKTVMPFAQPTLDYQLKVNYINVTFLNKNALEDKKELKFLFEEYSRVAEKALLPRAEQRQKFRSRLQRMEKKALDFRLISNTASVRKENLESVNAYTIGEYKKAATDKVFNVWVSAKYLNILSSASFLHELTHAILMVEKMPDNIFTANTDKPITPASQQYFKAQNVMLSEGLAEYISRNKGILNGLPVFEHVHTELRFLKSKGMPWLSLDGMKSYYYGKKEKSFERTLYALTSAHSLVNYLVQKYGVQTVIELIYVENIPVNAVRILKRDWASVIADWHRIVGE